MKPPWGTGVPKQLPDKIVGSRTPRQRQLERVLQAMPPQKSPRCMNCKKNPSVAIFEGVMICNDCNRIVEVVLERRRRELAALDKLYRDKLRVTLLEGKLSPKVVNDECGTGPNKGTG